MIFLYAFALLAAVAAPLLLIYRRVRRGHRGKAPLIADLCSFFGVMLAGAVFCLSQGAAAASDTATAVTSTSAFTTGMGYIAAALAVGLSGIGGGIAVAASSAAALGAISENDSIFGKSLIYVGLAEGIALYGLLISFMILTKL